MSFVAVVAGSDTRESYTTRERHEFPLGYAKNVQFGLRHAQSAADIDGSLFNTDRTSLECTVTVINAKPHVIRRTDICTLSARERG